MKMSAFPLAGFPHLATTQLLMSAAGGLNLPATPTANSPKDLSGASPTSIAAFSGRIPGVPDALTMGGHPGAGPYGLPPQLANMPPSMLDPRLFMPGLSGGYDMKENADALMAWRHIAAQAQAANVGALSYESHAAAMAASYSYPSYPAMDLNGARRKNATRETTSTLKAWLYEHRKNPYPTKGEKIMLAILTKMSLTQVSTWFANARRRLKKENKMTWSPRNRTDDGSSVDDEEKADNDVVDEEDDVSIDLSDFETDGASPQKMAAVQINPSNQMTSVAAPSQSQTSIPYKNISTDSVVSENSNIGNASHTSSSKPRIWSLADVATSKPSTTSHTGPIHHHAPSVRHRPYSIPNSPAVPTAAAFRPWFDSAYRQLAGHPALGNPAAALVNPLLAGRPTIGLGALRVPHLTSSSTHSTHSAADSVISSHSIRSPVSSVGSSGSPSRSSIAERTISHEADSPNSNRSHARDGVSPPQSNSSKPDVEH